MNPLGQPRYPFTPSFSCTVGCGGGGNPGSPACRFANYRSWRAQRGGNAGRRIPCAKDDTSGRRNKTPTAEVREVLGLLPSAALNYSISISFASLMQFLLRSPIAEGRCPLLHVLRATIPSPPAVSVCRSGTRGTTHPHCKRFSSPRSQAGCKLLCVYIWSHSPPSLPSCLTSLCSAVLWGWLLPVFSPPRPSP